jgi:voltage-gated potassium channel
MRRARGSAVTARQLLLAVIALTAVCVAGTIGFVVVDNESGIDALYRTINAMTTAGAFTAPASTGGKLMVIAMLLAGVALFLYVAGLLVELIVGGISSGALEQRRMRSRIADLRGHSIICGYGRVGTRVARELAAAGVEFVTVDAGESALARAEDDGVLHVAGDGSDDDALRSAGIASAAGLVACVDDDAVNVYIVLTAKGLRPDLHVVARASNEAAAAKLHRAGADQVISPYAIAGERIADMLLERADVGG